MKVLVECRFISPAKSGGIENYAYSITKGISRFVDEVVIDICASDRAAYEAIFKGYPNISFVSDPVQAEWEEKLKGGGIASRLAAKAKAAIDGESPNGRRRKWAESLKADAVFYPFHLRSPQHLHLPTVTTIHAILPEYGPVQMQAIEDHVRTNAAVVVSWPHPYRDLTGRYPSVTEKLFQIPYISPVFVGEASGGDFATEEEPYFLYTTFIAPRKNHANLIRAYAEAAKLGADLPKVKCPGRGSPDQLAELIDLAKNLGMAEKFDFLGYVSNEDLVRLYRGCEAVVAPTIWEAASSAVFEGVLYGKGVACSDVPPLTEYANFYGIEMVFFDPQDPVDMGRKLIEFHRNLPRFTASSLKARETLRLMDEEYAGYCYSEVLKFAAGKIAKPEWAPFLSPTSFSGKP